MCTIRRVSDRLLPAKMKPRDQIWTPNAQRAKLECMHLLMCGCLLHQNRCTQSLTSTPLSHPDNSGIPASRIPFLRLPRATRARYVGHVHLLLPARSFVVARRPLLLWFVHVSVNRISMQIRRYTGCWRCTDRKQASGTLANCFTASSSASASAFFPAFPSICLPQYLHLPGLTHQLKPTMSCTPSGLNLHLGHGNIICEPPAPEPPKRSRAAPVAEPRWHRSQKDHGDIIAGRDQQIQIGTGKRRTVNEIHESFSCLMIVPSPTRILRIMCSSLQKQTCFSCPV